MPAPELPRNTFAMQCVAMLNAALALGFLAVIALNILPNLGTAFALEPVRIVLAPVALALVVAASVLAWRWRRTGAEWTRWLVLGAPALAFLAIYAWPLSRDLVHPAKLPNYAAGAIAILAATGDMIAALVATFEARSGSARLRGPDLSSPRASGAIAATVVGVLLVISGAFLLSTSRPSGGATPGQPAQPGQNVPPLQGQNPSGYTSAKVADGVIPQLPDGTLYASVATGGPAPGPGILYVVSGSSTVSSQTVAAGQAAYVPPGTQADVTAGSGASLLYVSFRRTADKSSAAHEVCQSHDLPSLPNVNQAETLYAGTLKSGGRSDASRTGGVEVIVDVDGQVEVRAGTLSSPQKLSTGQCVTLLEGTPVQVFNAASSTSHFIALYLAPSGAPVSTPVNFGL